MRANTATAKSLSSPAESVFEALTDRVEILTGDGRVAWINASGARSGMSSPPACGADWISQWGEAHKDEAATALREASTRGNSRFVAQAHTDNGQLKRWDVSLTSIRSPDDGASSVLCVSRDITSLVDRFAQDTTLETAFAFAPIGEALVGLDGRFLKVNPALCRLTGYDERALLAKDFQSITHPDDLEADLAELERLLAGDTDNYRMEKRYLRGDGSFFWADLSVALVRNSAGEPSYFISQIQDLSERKEAECALAHSEANYRRLAERVGDIVINLDRRGVLTYVSPASTSVLGYAPEEMEGRNLMEFVLREDRGRLRDLARVYDTGEATSVRLDYRLKHKNGSAVWIESSVTLDVDPRTGRPCGGTDILRDVSERRALMAELESARKDAEAAADAKSEFLANMSHELRTPLTSIIGFTRLALDQPDLSELTRGHVSRVADASQALLATVNDVLDFSKLEAGQVSFHPEPVPIQELLSGTLDLFAPQAGAKDIDLALESSSDVRSAILLVDPNRLRQVLLNLVGNAVKFTQRGAVTVRASWVAAGRLRVEVVDTGPGIADEKRDRLFQRFSQVDGSLTRSAGGTGLGLAICKGIVEAIGGAIGVQTELGVGSCFWFEIPAPLTEAAPRSDGRPAGESSAPLTGLQVLVVDDHSANRELARLFLAGAGAVISEAADGAEALAVCAEKLFDVVVMDIRMPNVDGPTALAHLRRNPGLNQQTPVLAFTADADADHAETFMAAGFDGVVAKPVSPLALISSVVAALEDREAEPHVACSA